MSMKGSARSSAKAKAKRLCAVRTGNVDASGWHQPAASKTPRMRRAYAEGGKVGLNGNDKYAGEVEKEACAPKRADKRPRKMDGGPMTGPNDPRQIANNMMQSAAARAPVSGNSPIPTYTSNAVKKSPLRGGFKKGGIVGKTPAITKTKVGTNYPEVPKRIQIAGDAAIKPNTDYGPEGAGKLKKGGRACKADGGAMDGDEQVKTRVRPGMNSAMAENANKMGDDDGDADDRKRGGRACKANGGVALDGSKKNEKVDSSTREARKAGGRVKGKTNINIIIAPSAPDAGAHVPPSMGAPGMKPPGMPGMGPPPPPGPGAPGAMPPGGGAGAPSPLAGLPPQLVAQALGGGGGQGASMPPSGPPHLPMRAAGGRIARMKDGAGGGLGRLEKAEQVRDAKKMGNRGL